MALRLSRQKFEHSKDKNFTEFIQGRTFIGGYFYDNSIGSLALPKEVNIVRSQYSLVFPSLSDGALANRAIAMQQSNDGKGLNFWDWNRKALGMNLRMAEVGDITAYHRDANLGVLYDTDGNLIKAQKGDKRLAQCRAAVNGTWVYLNDFCVTDKPGNSGFEGLAIKHVIGFEEGDINRPIFTEAEPLEKCVVDAWADVQGGRNRQGYYTDRAPVQEPEQGKTIFVGGFMEGYASVFCADWRGDSLSYHWSPQYADPGLGVFLSAEGLAT